MTRDNFVISKLGKKPSILQKAKRNNKDDIVLPKIKYESQILSPAKS